MTKHLALLALAAAALAACDQNRSVTNPGASFETSLAAQRVDAVADGQSAVYTLTNQVAGNAVAVFNRAADGTLTAGGTIATGGLFITGLSLFVGGIGIMNIMFVSVAERTREIGIRKAIGAKRRTILIQFLTEAATICLLGGLVGIGIAWPLTKLINRFMPTHMSFQIIGIAVLVSLLTGVISGFFPAWRAARMNPVDALRSE